MEIYEQLGCSPMWTCAPYQQPEGRPAFGQHIVGSESNAVGFFNSVLGARTNKYGDLLDVAAAIVGRVPLSGLHTDEGRRATHVFDVSDLPAATLADPNFGHLLGVVLGREVGGGIGAVVGIERATEDELKAIAAAAAAAGGVDLFHVVGVTPEAPTLEAATQGVAPIHHTSVTEHHLVEAARLLTNADGDEPLRAVCLGTPHFSVGEFEALLAALDGRAVAPGVTVLVTTSRAVAAELALRGWDERLTAAGVDLVLDTCTYYPPSPNRARRVDVDQLGQVGVLRPGHARRSGCLCLLGAVRRGGGRRKVVAMTSHMSGEFAGRWLVEGSIDGEVVKLDEAVSFWGGFDAATGRIIDQAHPQRGLSLAGKVVAMPGSRGSSGTPGVLGESLSPRHRPGRPDHHQSRHQSRGRFAHCGHALPNPMPGPVG